MRNHQFGALLSEGLLSVAHRRQKTKAGVERELHEQLSQDGFTLKASTISGWCRGFVPQDSRLVAWIVRYCVRHGRVDRSWAESVLTQARYHDHTSLLNDLFPSASAPHAVADERVEARERTQPHGSAIQDPLLPAPRRGLIGRDLLLHAVRAQMYAGESPLALYGLPGVGKTTLALALAHDQQVRNRFPDGVLWAGLGRKPNLLELLSRWGRLLGLDQQALSALTTLESAAETVRTAIGQRRMVLILDDAWALDEALACLVGGPSCAHLLTTRFPELAVQVADPAVMRVPELDEEDGIRLLEKLVPTFVASAPRDARVLVQRVGGLPLALTLVGRYLQLESHSGQPRRLAAALARLRHGAGRLQVSQLQVPLLRQRHLPAGTPLSLDASIGVSYQSLSRRARVVLLALSTFPPKPNTFSEEAALYVADAKPELLDALLAAGLLESSGPWRYTMHQTITDFAGLRRQNKRLDERFIEYFVRFLETHSSDYAAMDREAHNCLTALDLACDWGRQADVLRGATAIAPFLLTRGLYPLAERYLLQAQIAAKALGSAQQQVTILRYLGEALEALGDYPRTLTLVQEGIALARECGGHAQLSMLLQLQGKILYILGDMAQAEASLQEGLELARVKGDAEQLGMMLSSLAAVVTRRGDTTQAAIYFEEGLALARQSGKSDSLCTLLVNMAVLAAERADYIQAEAYLRESLALARELGMQKRVCVILGNLGEMLLRSGRVAEAQPYLEEGLMLARQLGYREGIVALLQNLGEMASMKDNADEAALYIRESLVLAREIHHRHYLCVSLRLWGNLQLQEQHLEEAKAAFGEALDLAQEGNIHLQMGEALFGLAQVAAAEGDTCLAHDLGQRSLDILRALGHATLEQVEALLATLSARHRESAS